MTLRLEQRNALIAAMRACSQSPAIGRLADNSLRTVIAVIEESGYRIIAPTEAPIGKIVLTEALKADAEAALIDAALAMEEEGRGRRAPAVRAKLLGRAKALRELAHIVCTMQQTVDGRTV